MDAVARCRCADSTTCNVQSEAKVTLEPSSIGDRHNNNVIVSAGRRCGLRWYAAVNGHALAGGAIADAGCCIGANGVTPNLSPSAISIQLVADTVATQHHLTRVDIAATILASIETDVIGRGVRALHSECGVGIHRCV